MTERKPARAQTTITDPKRQGTSAPDDAPHTELRIQGQTPAPRSKTLPDELRGAPGEDDPFNDMPV